MIPRVAVVVAFALLVSSIAFVSCDARDNDVTAPQVDVRQYVTGEAANRLHPDGSFRLQEEFTSATEDVITTERAVDLAKAYLKTWGPIFERDWEAEYEGSIDLKKLRLDPRTSLRKRRLDSSRPVTILPLNVFLDLTTSWFSNKTANQCWCCRCPPT